MARFLERYCRTEAEDARIDWMVLTTGTLLRALAIAGAVLSGPVARAVTQTVTRTSAAPAAVASPQDAAPQDAAA